MLAYDQFWCWHNVQSVLVLAYDQLRCWHIIVNFGMAYGTVGFGVGIKFWCWYIIVKFSEMTR
ncbi:unnamed protein product [Callosobruchus maculatus]|uniref:Uncharacterized protein n=1 Tax=Callosobruchus maculatus TaxID=64391 RepID=A0A653CTY3_CALMS|nr:unnamed protein product [Callosobruchus maculatus]